MEADSSVPGDQHQESGDGGESLESYEQNQENARRHRSWGEGSLERKEAVNTVKWQRKGEKVFESEDFLNNRDNLTKEKTREKRLKKGGYLMSKISSPEGREIVNREIKLVQD